MGMLPSFHVLSVHAHYSLLTLQGAKLRLFLLTAKYFQMFFSLSLSFPVNYSTFASCSSTG